MVGFKWPLECLKKVPFLNLSLSGKFPMPILETFSMLYKSRLFYSYELLAFVTSLTKHNPPNMNHLDENSPIKGKLM